MRSLVHYDLPDITQTEVNGKRHYITPEGKIYPSVTTISGSDKKDKEGLQKWIDRVGEAEAERIKNKAAIRGTRLHKLCEDYLFDRKLVYGDPINQSNFLQIKPWVDEIGDLHGIELPLYSDHLRTAGRTDVVGPFRRRMSIIDFKSSNRKKTINYIKNYFIQTSAYAVAFEERTGVPVDQLVIIIAVDQEDPQLFIEQRDTWVPKFIELREQYDIDYPCVTS